MNVETKADTRYWKSLPNTIHVQSLKIKNVNNIKAVVNALDKFGNVLDMPNMKTHIYHLPNSYTIIWAKSY
jgi:hypothetical protein